MCVCRARNVQRWAIETGRACPRAKKRDGRQLGGDRWRCVEAPLLKDGRNASPCRSRGGGGGEGGLGRERRISEGNGVAACEDDS